MPSVLAPLDAPATGTSPGWFTKSARHWLQVCRDWSFANGRIKLAELGGDQDVPFEQAFSNLAHAYLKDKAPKLLDYEVGFQLLEKNQESTKAVGVFGFKVGSQWLYAPVFFLNGDLKGHELLFLKSQDAFVPMKEAWINYLLGRKPSILGEGVDRNLSQLGVMAPSLYQLSRSPHKFASAPPKLSGWAVDALGALAHVATTPISTDLILPRFLKEAGTDGVRTLLHMCKQFPAFGQAVDRFYGLETLVKEATHPGCGTPRRPKVTRPRSSTRKIKMADFDEPKSAAIKGVKVITSDAVWAQGLDVIHDLSKDEKERLVKERVVVKDDRDDEQVTIAYNIQTKLELQNPDRTSVYEVLVKPDVFKKCLVILGPYDGQGRNDFVTVVLLDGDEHQWVNTHRANVWVTSHYDDEAFREWWDKLPEVKSLSKGKGLQLLINYAGQATCPFRVWEDETGDEGESKLYHVSFRDYARKGRPGWLPPRGGYHYRGRYSDYDGDVNCGCGPDMIRLTDKPGAAIRAMAGKELWVPQDFKKLTLKGAPKQEVDERDPHDIEASEPEPLDLGDALDMQLFIHSTTSPLRILADGSDVKVDGARYDKVAAVVHLVKEVGLREKQARDCIAQAEQHWRRTRSALEFRLLKRAAPGDPIGDMVRSAPSAPSFPEPRIGTDDVMGSGVASMRESEFQVPVADLSASKTDRSIYDPRQPDPKSMAVAQQAAQTGQKEVFDTSAMSALLKSVRPDNMVDRYLGDMMKGMDRTGRVLFNYYWHGEEFEDRYGKQDMPELEDGLRNSFEGQGDIILKLKQKTVDPDVSEGLSVDLSQVANS